MCQSCSVKLVNCVRRAKAPARVGGTRERMGPSFLSPSRVGSSTSAAVPPNSSSPGEKSQSSSESPFLTHRMRQFDSDSQITSPQEKQGGVAERPLFSL